MEEQTQDSVKERKPDPPGGFSRGTPVWTDRGLVPIEAIRVGDRVLSRPENDSMAPTAYKRVSHTLATKSADMMAILVGQNLFPGQPLVMSCECRIWTAYPFPGEEQWSWRPAECLQAGNKMSLQDGSTAVVGNTGMLFQWHESKMYTPILGLAWWSARCCVGIKVDFRGEGAPIFGSGAPGSPYYSSVDSNEAGYNATRFQTTVHKLTVEDNPTYFVGEMGVWVGCAKPD